MKLDYKILYGDLLIFKNLNDCMTINANHNNIILINRIEIMGEDLKLEDCNYDFINHSDNTFTKIEMLEGLEFYKKLKENNEI